MFSKLIKIYILCFKFCFSWMTTNIIYNIKNMYSHENLNSIYNNKKLTH